MDEATADIWDLVQRSRWLPQEQLARSRELWSRHGPLAPWAACRTSTICVGRMTRRGVNDGEPVAVWPNTPPDAVLAVLGDKRRATSIAKETWQLVAAIATSDTIDVDDPTIADDLKRLSQDFKGSAVYMWAWWAFSSAAKVAAEQASSADAVVAEWRNEEA